MTTNLIPLLARLHEAAPEVCRKNSNTFIINEYEFSQPSDMRQPQLIARRTDEGRHHWVFGRPALAWLADTLMAECEAREWDVELQLRSRGFGCDIGRRKPSEWIYVMPDREYKATLAEALLTALLAAVEAERV